MTQDTTPRRVYLTQFSKEMQARIDADPSLEARVEEETLSAYDLMAMQGAAKSPSRRDYQYKYGGNPYVDLHARFAMAAGQDTVKCLRGEIAALEATRNPRQKNEFLISLISISVESIES